MARAHALAARLAEAVCGATGAVGTTAGVRFCDDVTSARVGWRGAAGESAATAATAATADDDGSVVVATAAAPTSPAATTTSPTAAITTGCADAAVLVILQFGPPRTHHSTRTLCVRVW